MQNKDVQHFFKQNIFASLTQIFIFLFLLLFNILLARILGPNDFGIFIVVFSMALTVGMFADTGMNNLIMKFFGRLVRQKDARAPFYFRHLVKIKLVMVISLFLILFFSSDFLAVYLLHDASLGILFKVASFIAVAYSFFLFFDSFFASLNRYEYSLLANFMNNILRLILPVAILLLGFGVLEALYGILAAFLFSVIIIYFYFLKLFRRALTHKTEKTFGLRHFDKFLLYSAGIGILITGYNNLDTFILSFFRSPSEVSFYRTALSIATYTMALLPISGKFLFSAFVELQEKSKEFMKKAFNKTLRYAVILGVPAIFGVYLLSSQIVVLFYSYEYLPAAPALEVLSPLILIVLIEILTLNVLMITKRLKRALIVPAAALAYSIIGNIVLIPVFGYMAAAFNALVFHLISMLLGLYFCRDIIEIRMDWGNFFKSVFSSLVMGLFIYSMLSQIHNLVTAGLVVIVAMLVYLAIQVAVGGINKTDIELLKRAVPCPLWNPIQKVCRD